MKKDLDALQGTWTVTALKLDGRKMSAGMLAGATVVVKGNRFTSNGMSAVYKGTLELNTSTRPHRLDMKFDAGPEKGNTNLAIYKLDGDTWTMCIATRGTKRPSGFESKPETGVALETLTRGKVSKPAKKAGPPKKTPAFPVTEFEGEWKLVSAVMDGKPMEESLVQWVRRVTSGNETRVLAGPQVMLEVVFTHDSSASPKTIDYLNTAGSNNGKSQLGIYKNESGILTFCLAAPGKPRPKTFESVPGDRRTLTVWRQS